jgi:hypothetical protein
MVDPADVLLIACQQHYAQRCVHVHPWLLTDIGTATSALSAANCDIIMCMIYCNYCCCAHRFALAHVHLDDIASKAAFLRDMRQQLSNVLELVIAGKADALTDKADSLLANSHLLMTRLLPQYRAVPKLDGKGALQPR